VKYPDPFQGLGDFTISDEAASCVRNWTLDDVELFECLILGLVLTWH
jgi:hypothetical protein